MQCQISIDDKMLEKFFGRAMTDEEFADFCKSAIKSKIFEWQFIEGNHDPIRPKSSILAIRLSENR